MHAQLPEIEQWKQVSFIGDPLHLSLRAHTFEETVKRAEDGGTQALDNHIPVDISFPNLSQIHSSPDIFLIEDYLTAEQCEDMIKRAEAKGLEKSPVVYSGWTNDFFELFRLLAFGPAVWCAFPTVNRLMNEQAGTLEVMRSGFSIWGGISALFAGILLGWIKWRENNLQALRTSTSALLDGEGDGDRAYIRQSEVLLKSSSSTFEAPTVIKYDAGGALAPHYDANQAAEVEDANRGGQTLVTLLAYLNDVPQGGETSFPDLNVTVNPKRGSCLMFFPAAADGEFDPRALHE
eukprot:gene3460-4346_t